MSNGRNASVRQYQLKADGQGALWAVRDDTTLNYPAPRMVVLLRVGALAFLLAGLIGAIVWAIAFGRTGSDGLDAGLFVGAIFLAALVAGIAYVVDLLTFVKRSESVRA